jgi:hypothetical protein
VPPRAVIFVPVTNRAPLNVFIAPLKRLGPLTSKLFVTVAALMVAPPFNPLKPVTVNELVTVNTLAVAPPFNNV